MPDTGPSAWTLHASHCTAHHGRPLDATQTHVRTLTIDFHSLHSMLHLEVPCSGSLLCTSTGGITFWECSGPPRHAATEPCPCAAARGCSSSSVMLLISTRHSVHVHGRATCQRSALAHLLSKRGALCRPWPRLGSQHASRVCRSMAVWVLPERRVSTRVWGYSYGIQASVKLGARLGVELSAGWSRWVYVPEELASGACAPLASSAYAPALQCAPGLQWPVCPWPRRLHALASFWRRGPELRCPLWGLGTSPLPALRGSAACLRRVASMHGRARPEQRAGRGAPPGHPSISQHGSRRDESMAPTPRLRHPSAPPAQVLLALLRVRGHFSRFCCAGTACRSAEFAASIAPCLRTSSAGCCGRHVAEMLAGAWAVCRGSAQV
jgi:hypothetical protein